MLITKQKIFQVAYDNTLDALKPEWWAMEGLVVLEETLVMAPLVLRDYDRYFVNAGDTVHVNKPGTFTASDKVEGADTTLQNATATDTEVKLDQHVEVTFKITDREMQQSLPDLRAYFLAPAVRAIAERIDLALYGEWPKFWGNSAGIVGTAIDDDAVIDLATEMNSNNVPMDGRRLVVGPNAYADLLKEERFTNVNVYGANNSLRTGQVGDIMGFDVFMSQSVGTNLASLATTTSETSAASAQSSGITTVNLTGTASASHTKGTALTIATVPGIYYLTNAVTGGSSTSIAITPALKGSLIASQAITFYESAAGVVHNTSNYAAGSQQIITYGYTSANEVPQVGQAVSFGAPTTATWYTVVKVTGTWASSSTDITLTLNRPLDAGITNADVVNVGPAGGNFNLAFRQNALTLVNRPLQPSTAGVAAAFMDNGSTALRVTMAYDYRKLQHFITVDTLLGVKTLDTAQGAILLG